MSPWEHSAQWAYKAIWQWSLGKPMTQTFCDSSASWAKSCFAPLDKKWPYTKGFRLKAVELFESSMSGLGSRKTSFKTALNWDFHSYWQQICLESDRVRLIHQRYMHTSARGCLQLKALWDHCTCKHKHWFAEENNVSSSSSSYKLLFQREGLWWKPFPKRWPSVWFQVDCSVSSQENVMTAC